MGDQATAARIERRVYPFGQEDRYTLAIIASDGSRLDSIEEAAKLAGGDPSLLSWPNKRRDMPGVLAVIGGAEVRKGWQKRAGLKSSSFSMLSRRIAKACRDHLSGGN
jgi:hypothetical protein